MGVDRGMGSPGQWGALEVRGTLERSRTPGSWIALEEIEFPKGDGEPGGKRGARGNDGGPGEWGIVGVPGEDWRPWFPRLHPDPCLPVSCHPCIWGA